MSEPAALRTIGRQLIPARVEIIEEWRRRIAALPELQQLPPSAIVDHMPEFLYELARASAGDPEATRRSYEQIINGHALQRLGFGVSLSTLLEEYAMLRQVVLAHLLRDASEDELRGELLELDRAIGLAITGSVRTFSARRDELRDQFVSMLAHDLRGPLQALSIGAENILRRPCGDAAHERAAAAMVRTAGRMARLISDVVDFARGRLGVGIPAVPVTCNIGEVCHEVVDELRIAHPRRTLLVTTAGDLVGSWDRDRLLQAISNLAANALVHGRDPIEIRVFEDPDRQHVTTEVYNPGPPIPEALIPHLFDPYRQGATAASAGGLGLGLFIVQQIALAHGADCAVRSSEREGTTFSVRWPRAPLTEVPRPYQPAV
ncbi:MAG TPA: HAMP domain-containing sensor histidine kinase [Kofleriaceae bacterium]|nr:HAMP domain-containing sensor histidine kinase [Kofleriaceae bacterium]